MVKFPTSTTNASPQREADDRPGVPNIVNDLFFCDTQTQRTWEAYYSARDKHGDAASAGAVVVVGERVWLYLGGWSEPRNDEGDGSWLVVRPGGMWIFSRDSRE